METCYTSYQAISPHHNLARYCIKAACQLKSEKNIHVVNRLLYESFPLSMNVCCVQVPMVDCFSACSQHVSLKASKVDWQHWGMALASNCQR